MCMPMTIHLFYFFKLRSQDMYQNICNLASVVILNLVLGKSEKLNLANTTK